MLDNQVKLMKKAYKENKQIHWGMGFNADGPMVISCDDLVHAFVLGTTGSGKTETLGYFRKSLKDAYGAKVKFLDVKKSKKGYRLDELRKVLEKSKKEADRRGELFKTASVEGSREITKISQYRAGNINVTGKNLPELFIMIDDSDGYFRLMEYDSKYKEEGTVENLLYTGFSQWRKYGIHIVIANQANRYDSFPRRVFSSFTGGVVLRISEPTKFYLEQELRLDHMKGNLLTLNPGQALVVSGALDADVRREISIPKV